jgi:NADPH:quinone reductase-like Zn-dependent oxidoreductase
MNAVLDQSDNSTPSRADSMSAITQDAWGTDPVTTLRLTQIDRPSVSDGEVLVRVAATSVDQGTVHCMTGKPYAMRLAGFGVRSPKASNPGRAIAGTVVSVGAAVTGFKAGDEVYGTCDGAFAEYVAAQPHMLAHKPASLTFEQAAAAPISGATALQAIRKANVSAGQHVLVIGASGGVGTFAVQIAKAAGATVTGVCSAAKVELVRSLGADHVIDYAQADITDAHRRYDAIIDIAGNRTLSSLRRCLTERGTLVIVGGETGGRWLGGFDRSLRAVLISPFVGQTLGMLASKENAASLDELRALIDAGGVTPVVDRSYRLEETPAAIRRLMDGHARGKIIITI